MNAGETGVRQHERFMQRAIELTEHCPNQPFGCVIVDQKSGEIVAEGWNQVARCRMWHGEIDAIVQLSGGPGRNPVDEMNPKSEGPTSPVHSPEQLVLFSTAEPCAMCQSAILWTGIPNIVFGTSIETLIRLGWNQIEIPAAEVCRRTSFRECTILPAVLQTQCDALFEKAAARRKN